MIGEVVGLFQAEGEGIRDPATMTPDPPFAALATAGPAFAALQAVDWGVWSRLAADLESALPPAPGRDRRIHQLYVPLALWLAQRGRGPSGARVVGLSGPQGCGKTTLVAHLVRLLGTLGVRAATVSIDDFYLRREEQLALAAAHPGNRYLEHRAAPGTHDVELGARTLDALRTLAAGASLRVPAYDKSAHGGRGDRAPEAEWPTIRGPLDLVLFEGWMLGFQPVPEAAVAEPALRVVNALLARYQAWDRRIDDLIVLRTADPADIVRWRVEAEAARAASGLPALDAAAALDYIGRFLPLYDLYADGVAAGPWQGARRLVIWLDGERLPLRPAKAG